MSRWREIGRSDLGEEIYSSPAIVDGRVYVRTLGNLYCFGFEDFEAELERRATAISPHVWWAVSGAGCFVVALLGWFSWARLRKRPAQAVDPN